MPAQRKVCLVTVGSTKFESLIRAACAASFRRELARQGFTELRLQIGTGSFAPRRSTAGIRASTGKGSKSPAVDWFRSKPVAEWRRELDAASLIIGHAGAGTILEALRGRKPLLVVINEALMDNHQAELADAMAEAGYLAQATPDTLEKVLCETDWTDLSEYPAAQTNAFATMLDEEMGFSGPRTSGRGGEEGSPWASRLRSRQG